MKPTPATRPAPTTITETVSDGTLYAYRHRQRQDLTRSDSWLAQRRLGQEAQEHQDYHEPAPEDSFGVACLRCGILWSRHPEAYRLEFAKTGLPVLDRT